MTEKASGQPKNKKRAIHIRVASIPDYERDPLEQRLHQLLLQIRKDLSQAG